MQRIAQCGIFLSLSSGHKAAPLDKLCHVHQLTAQDQTRDTSRQGTRPNGLYCSRSGASEADKCKEAR